MNKTFIALALLIPILGFADQSIKIYNGPYRATCEPRDDPRCQVFNAEQRQREQDEIKRNAQTRDREIRERYQVPQYRNPYDQDARR